MTTTNSYTTWPALLPDSAMTMHSTKTRRNRPGLVKSLTLPAPPDEATVKRLNQLAARPPFCNPHKVKKHEHF